MASQWVRSVHLSLRQKEHTQATERLTQPLLLRLIPFPYCRVGGTETKYWAGVRHRSSYTNCDDCLFILYLRLTLQETRNNCEKVTGGDLGVGIVSPRHYWVVESSQGRPAGSNSHAGCSRPHTDDTVHELLLRGDGGACWWPVQTMRDDLTLWHIFTRNSIVFWH